MFLSILTVNLYFVPYCLYLNLYFVPYLPVVTVNLYFVPYLSILTVNLYPDEGDNRLQSSYSRCTLEFPAVVVGGENHGVCPYHRAHIHHPKSLDPGQSGYHCVRKLVRVIPLSDGYCHQGRRITAFYQTPHGRRSVLYEIQELRIGDP